MIPVHIFDKICQNCHICSIQHENWENIFLFYFKYYKSFSNYHDLFCKVFLLVCAQICDFTGQQHFFVVAITQTFLDAAFPNYKFIWWLKKKKRPVKISGFYLFFRYSCSSIASGFDVKKRPESGTRKWLQMELACFYTACAHCSLWNNCGGEVLFVS